MVEELGCDLRGGIRCCGQSQTPSVLPDWISRRLAACAGSSVTGAELRERRLGKDLAAQTVGRDHGP